MKINILEFDAAFVPFTAARLKQAQVLWANNERVKELSVTASGLDTKSAIIEKFSYVIPGELLTELMVEPGDTKLLLAERYGGDGVARNGGGARVGVIDAFEVKGIGKNPLSGEGTDDWHSYGGLTLADAALEAVNAGVFGHILPKGAVTCYAIIITGEDTAFIPSNHYGEKGPGALLVRELSTRPAHFLRAGHFRVRDELKAMVPDDVNRTRLTNKQLFDHLGGHFRVIEFLGIFLSNCAEQFSFSRVFRIYHGALSASNISFDGRWLDLTNVSFVGSGLNFAENERVVPLFGELSKVLSFVEEFVYTYTKYNRIEFDMAPLINYFNEEVEVCLSQHYACLIGLPASSAKNLFSLEYWHRLVARLQGVLGDRQEVIIATPIGPGLEDLVVLLLVDLFNSLGTRFIAKDDVSAAFCGVLEFSHKSLNCPYSFRNFAIAAAIESIKKASFCFFFFKWRTVRQIEDAIIGRGYDLLDALINSYVSAAKWIFQNNREVESIIYDYLGTKISYVPHDGLYRCRGIVGGNEMFRSAREVRGWIEHQPKADFSINGYEFTESIVQLLSVLSEIEH